MICSLCCGQTRTAEDCQGCSFFKGPTLRNYGKLPYFELQEMSKYSDLQDLAELLEKTVVQIDRKTDGGVGDALVVSLLERLLDKYHFGEEISPADEPEGQALQLFTEIIADELEYVADDKLAKVLGAIRRSVKRHTGGSRVYLDFIGGHIA
jgi:hypothetical protein